MDRALLEQGESPSLIKYQANPAAHRRPSQACSIFARCSPLNGADPVFPAVIFNSDFSGIPSLRWSDNPGMKTAETET